MEESPTTNINEPPNLEETKPNRLIIIPILSIGLILRVINISKYSLWSDEAGQVYAALIPRFGDFLDFISEHVMAMPLDYIVTRLLASITLEEGFLRIPALVWGVLSILFLFLSIDVLLRNHKNGRLIALLTALFLAISPVHIFYSQEIRFYSALTCFYWLSNFLLLRFLLKPKFQSLLLFTIFTLLGVFFHPYVFLIFINAGIFILFSKSLGIFEFTYPDLIREKTRIIGGLAVSAVFILVCFFAWFFYQQPNSSLNHELYRYSGSFLNFLLSGIGWRGYEWCDSSTLFGPWELFLSTTFLIGILLTSKDKTFLKILLPILITYSLQVALISVADYIRGYWLALRQIIHLAPILFVVNSFTISNLIEYISNRNFKTGNKSYSKVTLIILSILIIFIFVTPKIVEYYDVGKSNAREIIDIMLKSQPEVDQILVSPGYNSIVYELYLNKYFGITGINVIRTDLGNLSDFLGQDHYLITQVQLTDAETRNINQYYNVIYMPESRCFGDRALFFSK